MVAFSMGSPEIKFFTYPERDKSCASAAWGNIKTTPKKNNLNIVFIVF
jgi:hypothetical protein